jgi:Protein of unknown function (DUF732)
MVDIRVRAEMTYEVTKCGRHLIRRLLLATVFAAIPALGAAPSAPVSHADVVAYLVNVTVRPGYNFPNADAAVAYGNGLCAKIEQRRTYAAVTTDVKADFNTSDEFQASYLISQAVNELCPANIWQLRQSAGGYRPEAAP